MCEVGQNAVGKNTTDNLWCDSDNSVTTDAYAQVICSVAFSSKLCWVANGYRRICLSTPADPDYLLILMTDPDPMNQCKQPNGTPCSYDLEHAATRAHAYKATGKVEASPEVLQLLKEE